MGQRREPAVAAPAASSSGCGGGAGAGAGVRAAAHRLRRRLCHRARRHGAACLRPAEGLVSQVLVFFFSCRLLNIFY